MSGISPKPIIAQVLNTWRIDPGMKFALVEDVERSLWIVESCPVGTHAWTLAQAAELPRGARSGRALREAVRLGREVERRNQDAPASLDERVDATALRLRREPVSA